jgi:hypothetical protein
MRFLAIALIASSSLFNVACSVDTVGSDEVKTETIHQDYSLRYDEATDSTQLSAQFRVGGWSGTTVDLRSPAGISVNGKKLSKETFLGTRYSGAERGFIGAANFEYTDADGKRLTNAIRIDPVRLLKADQTVSVQRVYEVEIQAINPLPEDSFSVGLRQTSTRPDGTTEHLYADGVFDVARGRAVFSATQLNKLNNGPATLVISRSKSTRLQQSTREGGSIAASYNLRPVSVTIVDKIPSTVQQTLTLR